MSLNIRQFGASIFLALCALLGVCAQTGAPTSADVMRERVTKAKALIAVKNYNAAIYEMEGIRREINDPTVNGVVQVMLIGCYLEQGDYKRAQSLLTEIYNAQKANKPNANYYAVAAQVVKGARNQIDRYKSLGLTVSDRNLPIDAVNDVSRMRETVEAVIEQSKILGADKKQTADATVLLEEALNVRGGLAADDYDAKRWKNEIADVRENLMNSRAIVNAVDDSAVQPTNTMAVNTASTQNNSTAIIPISNQSAVNTNSSPSVVPDNKPKVEIPKQTGISNQSTAQAQPTKSPEQTAEPKVENKKETIAQTTNVNQPSAANTTVADNGSQQPTRSRRVAGSGDPSAATPNVSANNNNASVNNDAPMTVGSLVEYASEKINPVYPPAAKTVRMTGTVRVDLVVNEDGKVEVEKTTGPSMLQRAALDAVKRWKFKPFMRDGQPVKAKGYVSFNFNL